MIAHRVDVLPYDRISRSTRNYLIPLEVITRYYLAGSLWDRVEAGKVSAKSLGISETPKYGMPLPEPHFELTTKLEKVDRKLRMEEALRISGLSKDEMNELKEATLNIDTMITSEVGMRGLIHVDGKKEYAYDFDRCLMIVDTFGTADEDRWWLKKEYDDGNCVEFSKEFVRQHYRTTGYYDQLEKARAERIPEPDIPALPGSMIKRASKLYQDSFEAITGERFRPDAK
jgi:phosphoribosylaminoimidazole-succinocarboxamide synthase